MTEAGDERPTHGKRGHGSDPRALVVIPTYQEAATIVRALDVLDAAAPALHVLVVDDASPDGTGELVAARAERSPGLHLMRRAGKQGLGTAYLEGFAWGLERGYDVVVEMDADGSHDPAIVPVLLAGLEDADLVIGSRYVPGGEIPGWGWQRRALSAIGNRYASLALRLAVADLTSGFRAYRADLLRRVDLDGVRSNGCAFQIEMALRAALAGGRIAEVPIRFVDRTEGSSKMSAAIAAEALLRVTAWSLRPPALGRARPAGVEPAPVVASLAAGEDAPLVGPAGRAGVHPPLS